MKRTLQQTVHQMDTAHVVCRDLTHAWQPWTAERFGAGFKRVIRCERCATRRTDVLDRRGRVKKRTYTYSENYLVSGVGRLIGDTKDMMRLESLTRLINAGGDTDE